MNKFVKQKNSFLFTVSVFLLCGLLPANANGQTALPIDSTSFKAVIHDNLSNSKRQGSGLTPLALKSFPKANVFRDDAVGINFEHIFNGAKKQYGISMFTPRQDPCHLKQVGKNQYELSWPAKGSQWGLDAKMVYNFSKTDQIDLTFECKPTRDLYPQKFVAMMWASYMHRTHDRKIHFWGKEGSRTGWVAFGEGTGNQFEVGAVAHSGTPELPSEEGAQTLNLSTHPTKKFITPFYYGLIDGDHDLETTNDKLLFLVLFDQTDPIRFAMWNFFKDQAGNPDTHSPAWDWQYVIRNPQPGKRYGYRARVVIKPYQGKDQIWNEYHKWEKDLGIKLPTRTK